MSSSTFQGLLASICATSVLLLTAVSSPTAAQIVSLPSYNVDINQTSVSGLSAGGYMAVQFDVAFSSTLRGAGIIAGGPFYCAQGSVPTGMPAAAASTPPATWPGTKYGCSPAATTPWCHSG